MNLKLISRRGFIRVTAAGAGGLYITGCYNPPVTDYYALTTHEAAILDSLVDQIIPPDEYAGGKEAGVTNFIDIQLAGFYSEQREMYKKCLSALAATSMDIYGKEFITLEFEKQREFLEDIEAGKFDQDDWGGYTASGFFGTLCNHCMQGYYGSPRHGGNKDYVSYRMIRLDYPLIIGRNTH